MPKGRSKLCTAPAATGPGSEEDFRRMLEDKSIDAVVIATPHHWHTPMAIRAMRGGTGHPQHMYNFLDCVKSRKQPIAHADVAHLSCGLPHFGRDYLPHQRGRAF